MEAKYIKGYGKKYLIFPDGSIYSYRRKRFLKWNADGKGYYRVTLLFRNKAKTCHIHRLVAINFIPNPNNLPVVNHKDFNKKNNKRENLEWCTDEYNKKHYFTNKRDEWLRLKAVKVSQHSLDGKFIKKWESISGAAKGTGIDRMCILHAARNEYKQAGGYIWRFSEKE